MAVKMRLRRMGQKKAPFYRIIVADCRFRTDRLCDGACLFFDCARRRTFHDNIGTI